MIGDQRDRQLRAVSQTKQDFLDRAGQASASTQILISQGGGFSGGSVSVSDK